MGYYLYFIPNVDIIEDIMAKVQIWGYRCERCDHEWIPRAASQDEPKVCPKCKSPYWNTPRTRGVKGGKPKSTG